MIDIYSYVVYIFLMFVSVFFTYAGSGYKFQYNPADFRVPLKFLFPIIIISFMVGFRYNVGVDWPGYKLYYLIIKNNVSILYDNQQWEFSYFWINKIIALLGLNYTAMFTVVAFISWYFIFKSLDEKFVPLLLFFIFADEFFFWSMNGVRQFVSIAIFLYSINFIILKDFKRYILLILLASTFHTSALLLIPIYFIPYEKIWSPYVWFVLFMCSLFIGNISALSDSLYPFFSNIVETFSMFKGYLSYFERGKFNASEVNLGLGYAFRIIVAFFIFYFSEKIVKEYPDSKIYFILFFIGAIAFNLVYNYQLLGRINNYFLIMRPVVLSFIALYAFKNFKFRYFSVGLCCLYFIMFVNSIYKSSNMCSPYNFVF